MLYICNTEDVGRPRYQLESLRVERDKKGACVQSYPPLPKKNEKTKQTTQKAQPNKQNQQKKVLDIVQHELP